MTNFTAHKFHYYYQLIIALTFNIRLYWIGKTKYTTLNTLNIYKEKINIVHTVLVHLKRIQKLIDNLYYSMLYYVLSQYYYYALTNFIFFY